MSAHWNVTLNDTSPVISYYPYYDGFGLTNGWQIWYSESGFNTEYAYPGNGYSAHITSLPGANMTLQFYGTGIELIGSANCTYDITLDNMIPGNVNPAGDLLYTNSGLSEGNHTITLIAQPDQSTQQLAFERAIIINNLSNGQQLPQEITYGNTDTSFLNYAGNWSTATDSHIPNGTYHYTATMGSSVSMSFSGSIAVGIQGIANWGNWQYLVSLNGDQQVLNSSSYWFIPDTTLYYQGGLDPTQAYTLNITDSSEDGDKFSLNSVVLYQTSSPMSPGSSAGPGSNNPTGSTSGAGNHKNNAVIIGPVVGAVAVVAAIVAFLWWRSRVARKASEVANRGQFDLLEGELTLNESSTPFSTFAAQNPSRSRSEKILLGPLGGHPRSYGRDSSEVELIELTSPSSAYIDQQRMIAPAISPSTTSVRRLPTTARSDSSSSQLGHNSGQQPNVQLPDSEVDRILEIIAARIDHPSNVHPISPPEYRG
ncbi:hypothetical protein BJ138DRAFT_917311 [Hygrophoropsis aurantiaca]|uniref:Uncharacterized protein n=1 Tax=Hygrophoropsis aurantiaca TaxID=72124 RepID=A0ACB8AS00_9AGAM|nr:hypothetical protein BJ138DRAFT_917311 [Hygrophoropsis aurantiaca]